MKASAALHRFAVPVVVLGLCVPVLGQSPRRDGNWEITVDVDIEGMAQKIPSRTTTQCVTPEEAADARKTLPHHGHDAAYGNCTTSEHKVEGNHVTWSFKCDSPRPFTGTGDILYVDDNAYTGTIKMVGQDGQAMSLKYTGKRLGDCAK